MNAKVAKRITKHARTLPPVKYADLGLTPPSYTAVYVNHEKGLKKAYHSGGTEGITQYIKRMETAALNANLAVVGKKMINGAVQDIARVPKAGYIDEAPRFNANDFN